MFATKAEVTSFVEAVVAKTIEVAEQQKMVEPGFKVSIEISTSAARKRSWGGSSYRTGPFIKLAVAQYMGSQNATNNLFHEYRSFASSPVIGSVRGTAEKTLATLVVHEVAHAIQYGVRSGSFHDSVIDDTGSHGVLWKSIYATLRNAIINGDAFDDSQYKKVVVENAKRVVKAVKTARAPRARVSAALKEQMLDEYKELFKLGWSTYKASRMIAAGFDLNQNTAVYYCYKFKKILEAS